MSEILLVVPGWGRLDRIGICFAMRRRVGVSTSREDMLGGPPEEKAKRVRATWRMFRPVRPWLAD